MDWLLNLGYWGLLLGTFLAGTVLPLSSDLLLGGLLVGGGNPWLCLLMATIGNGSGAFTSYLLGRLGKWEWLEKYFRIKPESLEKQKTNVDRYGVWGAFFSWFPVVGQLFMVALGFYRARPATTAILTYAGCFVRFLVWVLLYVHYGDAFIDWLASFKS